MFCKSLLLLLSFSFGHWIVCIFLRFFYCFFFTCFGILNFVSFILSLINNYSIFITVTCSEPPRVRYAVHDGFDESSLYPAGRQVTYTCIKGYIYHQQNGGNSRAMCNGEGEWVGLGQFGCSRKFNGWITLTNWNKRTVQSRYLELCWDASIQRYYDID